LISNISCWRWFARAPEFRGFSYFLIWKNDNRCRYTSFSGAVSGDKNPMHINDYWAV